MRTMARRETVSTGPSASLTRWAPEEPQFDPLALISEPGRWGETSDESGARDGYRADPYGGGLA